MKLLLSAFVFVSVLFSNKIYSQIIPDIQIIHVLDTTQCEGTALLMNDMDYSNYYWLDTDSSTVLSSNIQSMDTVCIGLYYLVCTDGSGTNSYPIEIKYLCDAMEMYNTVTVINETYAGQCNGIVTANGLVYNPDYPPLQPITYNWQDEFGNVIDSVNALDSACAGTYMIYTEEGNGCWSLDTFTVGTQLTNPAFYLDLNIQDASPGNCDGSVTVNPIGGVPPFTYLYSDTTTNQTNSGLCPGFYFVEVWDSNNDYGFMQFLIVDQSFTISNSTIADSLVTDTLNGSPVEDCSIDFANIFSASITNTNHIGDTIYVDWLITYVNTSTTTLSVPYYADSSFTGIYAFTLSLYCTQKALNGSVKVFDQSADLYLNAPENSLSNAISIYPNPGNSFVHIKSPTSGRLEIYSVRGKLLESLELKKENRIDLNSYENGMYLFVFEVDNQRVSRKYIKE